MDREERDLISENITQLVEDVIPIDMLPYLPCLTKSDKEKIKCEETNHGSMRAAQELIDRLVRRRNSFRELITALCETGCRHLAVQLCPLQFHEENEQGDVIRDARDDRNQEIIITDFRNQIALDDVNHA